jgi:hypothetical protein
MSAFCDQTFPHSCTAFPPNRPGFVHCSRTSDFKRHSAQQTVDKSCRRCSTIDDSHWKPAHCQGEGVCSHNATRRVGRNIIRSSVNKVAHPANARAKALGKERLEGRILFKDPKSDPSMRLVQAEKGQVYWRPAMRKMHRSRHSVSVQCYLHQGNKDDSSAVQFFCSGCDDH